MHQCLWLSVTWRWQHSVKTEGRIRIRVIGIYSDPDPAINSYPALAFSSSFTLKNLRSSSVALKLRNFKCKVCTGSDRYPSRQDKKMNKFFELKAVSAFFFNYALPLNYILKLPAWPHCSTNIVQVGPPGESPSLPAQLLPPLPA